MNATTTRKITGSDAIRLAERDNLTIYCAANPLDNGGIITAGEARGVVREDPSLVCVRVTPRGWWDGQRVSQAPAGYDVDSYFTASGMYLGPDDDGIEPTWDDAVAEQPLENGNQYRFTLGDRELTTHAVNYQAALDWLVSEVGEEEAETWTYAGE